MQQKTSLRPVLLPALVAILGGFLFGYDTAVINGANTFLQTHFNLDEKRDAFLIGLATASALIGCIPGAMSAGFLSDKFGRRKVLFICAFLYALSAVLSAVPQTFTQFILARTIGGVAVGISSMICPVYIAELAPAKWRGRLGTLFQVGIVVGIFITLYINLLIARPTDAATCSPEVIAANTAWNTAYAWRWMLASEVAPALFLFLLLFPAPESPKWLVKVKREPEAEKVLSSIGGAEYAREEIAATRADLLVEHGSFFNLFTRKYRLPLMISLVLMAGSQLSGINVIMYYSTNIFKTATGDANAGFMASVWLGLVNMVATLIAVAFVDKLGRKPLLLIGNAVQVLALAGVGYLFKYNPHSPLLLWGVILYVAAFSMAMGPLPWVICSEIFPDGLRGRAMSVATFFIWGAALAVSQTFPQFKAFMGEGPTFGFYAVCSLLTLLFVLFFLPETKGRSLEEISATWAK